MPLQTSGQISINDIHVEAGGASGTSVTINDADIRDMIGKGSGVQTAFSEYYGASSGPTLSDWIAHCDAVKNYDRSANQKIGNYISRGTNIWNKMIMIRYHGNMWGSPMQGTSRTNIKDTSCCRLIHHMCESQAEFNYLVDNDAPVLLQIEGAVDEYYFYGTNRNGYNSYSQTGWDLSAGDYISRRVWMRWFDGTQAWQRRDGDNRTSYSF